MEEVPPSKKAKTEENSQNFPPEFLSFLQENEIDPKVYEYAERLPRYIRVHPKHNISKEDVEKSLKTEVTQIDWMPSGFYKLDPSIKIADSDLYKDGKIFGIDLSSAAAVIALDLKPDEDCLDLCCAPGAKLCYLSNILGEQTKGSVTGVDISEHRLAACRTMCKKYQLPRVRLFLDDGTKFNHLKLSSTKKPFNSEEQKKKKKRKKKGKNYKPEFGLFYESFLMRNLETSSELYDKVIVDAECTHDGSVKHITKYDKQWGWETFEKRFMDPQRISTITQLQKDLLSNGFRMLKVGGILVYSTCSFSKKQNEEVVSWFLEKEPTCEVLPIDQPKWPVSKNTSTDPRMSKLVRFDPISSETGGLFIAKLTKLSEPRRNDSKTN